MVLGRSEDEIDKHFETDFDQKGIPPAVTKEYLIDQGLSVIEKSYCSSIDRQKSNKRMLQPFADAHIVSVQEAVDAKSSHAVVMTKTGKILDPAHEPMKDFYFVLNVLGIFYD
jgi:hypothetical protein